MCIKKRYIIPLPFYCYEVLRSLMHLQLGVEYSKSSIFFAVDINLVRLDAEIKPDIATLASGTHGLYLHLEI